jgi:hypothetical protein
MPPPTSKDFVVTATSGSVSSVVVVRTNPRCASRVNSVAAHEPSSEAEALMVSTRPSG